MRRLFLNDNLDIIVSDFQKNDKRKYWKIIRYYVNNKKQYHFFYSSFMFSTSKRWQPIVI